MNAINRSSKPTKAATIPEWIRAARTHAALSPEQLGEQLSLAKDVIAAWEDGSYEPSYHQLISVEMITRYPLNIAQPGPAGSRPPPQHVPSAGSSPLGFRPNVPRALARQLAAFEHEAVVKGNCMKPTVVSGDVVIVDTRETQITDGKVYSLEYGGAESVKRLFRLPGGGFRIVSDNCDFDPVDVAPEVASQHVRIIGRVVERSGAI